MKRLLRAAARGETVDPRKRSVGGNDDDDDYGLQEPEEESDEENEARELPFSWAASVLVTALHEPRSFGRLLSLVGAGSLGRVFHSRLKRQLALDSDPAAAYGSGGFGSLGASFAATSGDRTARSAVSGAGGGDKEREEERRRRFGPKPRVTVGMLAGALLRREMDDMEAEVARRAEAERQRLMEAIAATRVHREEVSMPCEGSRKCRDG